MRTYQKGIGKKKFERVRRNGKSQIVRLKNGVFVPVNGSFSKICRHANYMLGDYIYSEVISLKEGRTEYFRYRVAPVKAYAIDHTYYEARLLEEEAIDKRDFEKLMRSVSFHPTEIVQ